jgi:glycerol-1-phosphatase
VTAEDVEAGKPEPACYRLGRRKLGLPESAPMLVLEDAPAGIRAGKAAGCQVLAVVTTHRIEDLEAAGADWIVKDLRSVKLVNVDAATGGLTVEISGALP